MSASNRCKVDYIIDRYGLSVPGSTDRSMDEHLVARWTGRDGDPVGYHRLTDWFNQRLLKQVYERNGRDTIGTRVASDYRAVTGDDDIVRQEVIDDLKSDGIPAESLVRDMVSWSTMRRHLNGCLDAEKPTPRSQKDWELESIDIARNRTKEKVEAALRSLSRKQRLPEADKADVDVQIKLSCPECPTRIPLEDAIVRGFVCKDHFETAGALSTDRTTPAETD